jgi:hypothetical protein
MTEQRLPGGRSFGAVRVGGEARRPAQPWTATVHSVLRALEDVGFDGAPRARGFDEQGRERLTFLPGQTLGETTPWPDWLRSDDALRQVGAWLRRLHDATATFRPAAAMIRQFADGGEPTFQRMLPWAADLERSGNEVAELPDEFWQRPGR